MPTCGGMLHRRKYVKKKYFYEHKCTFFYLFKRTPNFTENIFLDIFYRHIEPACQKLCFFNENEVFWPLKTLFAVFKRVPKLIKNEMFKTNILSFSSYVTMSLLARKYISITKTATQFKRARSTSLHCRDVFEESRNSSTFQKIFKVPHNGFIKTLRTRHKVCVYGYDL